jgi:hypothetical protein
VKRRRHRQHGGAISLLLTVLAIGLLAYFALRGSASSPSAAGAPVDCERRISALIRQTAGQGDAYNTGYAALPAACQKLVPAPGTLAPSAAQTPDT